jgi:pSer/pThr/pTyr-binding forkhead associated (FHA) protein
MTPIITLTLLKENGVAGEYVFDEPGRCVVGRAVDCDVCVPADPIYQDVSRHHCAFEIDPPLVRVRDLNSLNGTFVNGIKVGQRENLMWTEDPTSGTPSAVDLHAGDEIQLGQHTLLRVSVFPLPEFALHGLDGADERRFDEELNHANRN